MINWLISWFFRGDLELTEAIAELDEAIARTEALLQEIR